MSEITFKDIEAWRLMLVAEDKRPMAIFMSPMLYRKVYPRIKQMNFIRRLKRFYLRDKYLIIK